MIYRGTSHAKWKKKEIINYKATNTTFGYNMADGGTGGLIGIGQLGKTWKVSDTTNMKLACHQFYTSDKWYASKSERAAKFKGRCNYQYKGDIITPWGIFETIISCTTAAKSIRQINKNMNVITDNSTLKKYITNLDTPLNSSGGRTPVEWRGQTPRCLGFNFISNNKEIS